MIIRGKEISYRDIVLIIFIIINFISLISLGIYKISGSDDNSTEMVFCGITFLISMMGIIFMGDRRFQ